MQSMMVGHEMDREVFQRKTCRLCRSSDMTLVLKLEPTPIGNHYVSALQVKETQKVHPLELIQV